jgi:hypothetical protein
MSHVIRVLYLCCTLFLSANGHRVDIISGTALTLSTELEQFGRVHDRSRMKIHRFHSQSRLSRKFGTRRYQNSTLEPETEGEEAAEPIEMSVQQNVWLQVGWIVTFLGMLISLVLYMAVKQACSPDLADIYSKLLLDEDDSMSLALIIMKQLNSFGVASSIVNSAIVVVGLLNFYTYSVQTEIAVNPGYILVGLPIDHAHSKVMMVGLVFFTTLTLLRLLTIHTHPDWSQFGATALLRYSVGSFYTLVEMIALGVTYYSWATSTSLPINLLWLFLLRSCEMLERSGAGLGFRQLGDILGDSKLLLVATTLGLAVWLVASCLYCAANCWNEEAFWDPNDQIHFQRFQSIPSSMWYVMINLLKEHPLADVHQTLLQRTFVCLVCIFAVPIFALPTSIVQNSLTSSQEEEEEADNEQMSRRATRRTLAAPVVVQEAESIYLGLATFLLTLLSTFSYFYYTASDNPEGKTFLYIPIYVSEQAFGMIDGGVGIVFLAEHAWRLSKGRGSYAFSGYGIIDFLAWLPGIYNSCSYQSLFGVRHEVLAAFCVFRIFKLERYLHSFHDMLEIIKSNSSLLTASLILAGLNWMCFSVAFYFTERENPGEEMADEVYGSIPRAIWAELVNLHGEWPWADYTVTGKAIGAFVGIFSIMLFCIPISVFGDGFMLKIQAKGDSDDEYDRNPWEKACRPEHSGLRQQIYDCFYGHLHGQAASLSTRILRAGLCLLVSASTMVTIISTVQSLEIRTTDTKAGMVVYVFDVVAAALFTTEYLARSLATGGGYTISFLGSADLLSLLAIMFSCRMKNRELALRPSYSDETIFIDSIVLLRLLRFFSLDNWLHSINTMKCVVVLNRGPLSRAGGALISVWFVSATLLYICENPVAINGVGTQAIDSDGEVTMAWRYRSVLTSLQYSLVHIAGDFPITDYTFEAKIVHFFNIVAGIAIMSAFCGIFSAGFVDFFQQERAKETLEKLNKETARMAFIKLRLNRAVKAFRLRKSQGVQRSNDGRASAIVLQARAITYGWTDFGSAVRRFFNLTVILSLCNSLIGSMPQLHTVKWAANLYVGVELICSMIFLVEWVIRMIAVPAKKRCSFWSVFDFICCLPGLALLCWLAGLVKLKVIGFLMVETLAMFRAARILNFPYFHRETFILSEVLKEAIPGLAVPGYLALNVWIFVSASFMWVENAYAKETIVGGQASNLTDIPSAMYFMCICLGGEWPILDFSYPGSRLCILCVLFGIAIFAIPIGIVVEAMQAKLQLLQEEAKMLRKMMLVNS